MHVSLIPAGARSTGTRWEARVATSPHGGRILRLDVDFGADPRPALSRELAKLGIRVPEWTHHPLTGAWSGTAAPAGAGAREVAA